MASITVTTETSPYPRFGVALTAWAADGPVDVYRVHADTSRWLVRGVSAVSGGVAFGYDYEAPYSAVVHYEAISGTTSIVSSDVSLALDTAVLSAPGLPAFTMVVTPVSKPRQVTLGRDRTVLQPWGRSSAVVLGDTRKTGVFTIRFRTYGHAESDALANMFNQVDVLLLRLPRTRYPWQYVDVGDVDESPVLDRRAYGDPADATDPGTWSEWDVPCVTTGAPIGGIFGDPTASYQAWKDDPPGTSYDDDDTNTYLQLLQGL